MNTDRNSIIQVLLIATSMLLAGGHNAIAQTNNNGSGALPPSNTGNPSTPINTNNSPPANSGNPSPPINTNNSPPANSGNPSPPIDTNSSLPANTGNPSTPNINSTNNNINSFDSSSYSTSSPNCSGTCVFGIGKNDRLNGWQFTTGVIWNINSPERTQAENSKITALAQSQKINLDGNLILMEKLTQAITSGQEEQANGLAIILAQRLGYSNHKNLIREIRTQAGLPASTL